MAEKKIVERDWDDISTIRRGATKAAAKKEAIEEDTAEAEEAKPRKAQEGGVEEEATAILEEMKTQGVGGAIVRADGMIVHSTLAMTDASAGILASASNITGALMKRSGDTPREIEMAFGQVIFVVIPIGTHLFCGSVKNREQKKVIRDCAEKARKFL